MTSVPVRLRKIDIWRVVTETGLALDLPVNMDLARHIFAAKEVPLTLLGKVAEQREVHRPDWPAVEAAVAERLKDFDFYFEFVVQLIDGLKPLWVE